MTRLLIALSLALACATTRAQQAPEKEKKRNTSIGLKTKITIQVKDMPVSELLTILTEAAQAKLVMVPAFPGHRQLTLDVKDLPLSTVFNQIAKRTGTHWLPSTKDEKLVVTFAPKKKS